MDEVPAVQDYMKWTDELIYPVRHSRRLKTVEISAELMAAFLVNPVPPGITQDGLPPDAKVVNCEWAEPRLLRLIVESDSFDLVPEGQWPPPFLGVRFSVRNIPVD